MARKIIPLSDKEISKAKPKDSPYKLFDGSGLYLLVTSTGSKLWRFKYKFDGKEKLASFGAYPTVSLIEARLKREAFRKCLIDGIDPQEQSRIKKAERKSGDNTFQSVALRFLETKKGKVTDTYLSDITKALNRYVYPVIGNKNIKEIANSRLLLELLLSVSRKEHNGKQITAFAKRLNCYIAQIFDFAVMEIDGLTGNPCRVLNKYLPSHKKEHYKQLTLKELPNFLQSLEASNNSIVIVSLVWLMLYTGQRQISLRRAKWSDFDLENAIWQRQPEKKDSNVHIIPLPRQAIYLLETLKQWQGGLFHDDGFVFISSNRKHKQINQTTLRAVFKRLGYGITPHGLRGTVTTGLNELGYDYRIIETQIGHALKNQIEASYNKAKLLEQRQKMVQEWADYLDVLKRGNVIPFIKKGIAL